jgi:hypothetical protein
MTATAKSLLLAATLAVLPLAAGPVVAMPVAPLKQAFDVASADVVPVYHRGKPHRRARVTVTPRRYYAAPRYGTPLYFDDPGQYPYSRGFMDRNPVPRANQRGCTVDLGYGRYEPCE